MIIRDIIFSTTPPVLHNVLWVKAGANNINELCIFDGGWRKIGTSSGGGEGTFNYNELNNKPKINNVVLEGNLSLKDLGIILPDLSDYVTEEALKVALGDYAKKGDIPSVEGLLSSEEATELYQPKGEYALKQDIPNTDNLATKEELKSYALKDEIPNVDNFITENEVNIKLEGYATKDEIPNTSGLVTKNELSEAISGQKFKTINGKEITGEGNIEIKAGVESVNGQKGVVTLKTINNQEITGEGNIEISGGQPIEVDMELNPDSNNPIANSAIAALLMRLDEKVFPTTFSVSGGGTYDDGTTQTVMVSWKLQKDGTTLTPTSVTVNGESVDPSVNYKVFTDVTTTTTYRVVATYNGKTYTGQTTATFKVTYYRYYGALPENTEIGSITADMVKGLKKEVCTSASAILLFTTENQRMCYAYPSRFGKLTTIKDTNLNAPFDDFLLESTLDVDGIEYYVYALTTPNFVTDYSVTFVK